MPVKAFLRRPLLTTPPSLASALSRMIPAMHHACAEHCSPTHRDHVILQLLEGPAAVVGTAAVGAVERRCGRAAVACFKCVLGAIAAETGGTDPHQPLFLSLGQVKVGWAYIPGLKAPS